MAGELSAILGVMQLVVIAIGIAAIFIRIGRRDEQLSHLSSGIVELKEVVDELVRLSVKSKCTDEEHARALEDLKRRVGRLESGVMGCERRTAG